MGEKVGVQSRRALDTMPDHQGVARAAGPCGWRVTRRARPRRNKILFSRIDLNFSILTFHHLQEMFGRSNFPPVYHGRGLLKKVF